MAVGISAPSFYGLRHVKGGAQPYIITTVMTVINLIGQERSSDCIDLHFIFQ